MSPMAWSWSIIVHLWPKLIFAQPMFSTSILTFSRFNNSWKLLVTSSYPPWFIHVFFLLNNTSKNKANILSKHFKPFLPSHPLQNFDWWDIQCSSNSHHSCSSPSSKTWFIIQLVLLMFCLWLAIYSIALQIQLSVAHLWIINLPHYLCIQSIDPLGIHLLHCAHGNECTKMHGIVCDVCNHNKRK